MRGKARTLALTAVASLIFWTAPPVLWTHTGQLAGAATVAATTRVSVSSSGAQGNSGSIWASISGDGRYVAFASGATNLVSRDTNHATDIFVRDRTSQSTVLASVATSGKQGNGISTFPAIASQGRYVAFESGASNLVSGDHNGVTDIFVYDLTTGATSRESISSSGAEANGRSQAASISSDGRYVAFMSSASNLVPGDTNGVADIFVRDRTTGTTERVSVSASGVEANGPSTNGPAISGDGRHVVFDSDASNLVPSDTNGRSDIFVYDRTSAIVTRVSVSSFREEGNSSSYDPAISADGRYVAFMSSATNLVPNDFNRYADIFVYELGSGLTTRVSVSSAGTEANESSWDVALSADGRFTVFSSPATNLTSRDANLGIAGHDIFLHDATTGITEMLSVDSNGVQGVGQNHDPVVSDDGRYVAFHSDVATLVPGDTNNSQDVFLRDRGSVAEAPAVTVDEPTSGDEVFADQTLAATVSQGFSAARVDFLVDGGIVGSDSSAPYSVQWSTASVEDGDHSVSARAVASGGGTSQSNPVSVEVINSAACDGRIQADFDAGRIDLDEYVRSGLQCVYEPRLLSERHASSALPLNTEGAYSRFIAQWNNVSQATRDEVVALLSAVNSGFYATQIGSGRSTDPRRTVPTSTTDSSPVDCHYGIGMFDLPTGWCEYTSADGEFHFRFAPEGYTNEIPMADNDANGIPDRIDLIESSLRTALAKYTGGADHSDTMCDDSPLGYTSPDFPIEITLWRASFQLGGDGYAPPPALQDVDIYMDVHSDAEATYIAAHELFHMIQWRYASFADWSERQGTSMWMEATAEWATQQTGLSGTTYARSLPEFLGAPYVELEHGSIFDSDDREYGAFILAEYLEQQYGCKFMRQSWERIGQPDALGALEAIDDLLRNQEGRPGGLADILPDFWRRNYQLEAGPAGYVDPDLPSWKSWLANDPSGRTIGDGTDPSPRPLRLRMPLIGGKFVTGQAAEERGGAFFVDLDHDLGRPMVLRFALANRSLFGGWFTSNDIRLTLLSFSVYPSLCRPPQELPLVDGVVMATIELDATCRFSSLVITHTGALTGGTMTQEFAAKVDAAPRPGDVFVSTKDDLVYVYQPNGQQVTIWDTYPPVHSTAGGSAFDAAGNFYVTNFSVPSVSKFAPDGTLLGNFGSGYTTSPETIVFDVAGNMYVGHADGTKDIQKRDPNGALISSFDVATDDRGSDWIALRPDGCTMVYTSEGTRVLQYDVCSAQQLADFATVPARAYALGLLPDGGAVVADTSMIRRLSSQGEQVQTYDASGENSWFALGVDPDATSFWAADGITGHVYRFDVATGQVLVVIDTGVTSDSCGKCAIGGISIMPDTGFSSRVMRHVQGSSAWGFWASAPGLESSSAGERSGQREIAPSGTLHMP